MQVAICDDDVTDRVKVGELLAQKMRKRGEALEITYFDCGEDLVDQFESGEALRPDIFGYLYEIYEWYGGGTADSALGPAGCTYISHSQPGVCR